MATDCRQLGAELAARLGLRILGRDGHDVKAACIACDSCDAMRVHADEGIAQCYACGAKWSRLKLAQSILGDVQAAWALLEEIGLEQPSHRGNGASVGVDPLERIARQKGVTADDLKAFGARVEGQRVLLPMHGPDGEPCSTFDLAAMNGKGKCAAGKPSGLFLPGQKPKPGETWHIVEGPKDAAALRQLGLLACGLPGARLAARFAGLFDRCDVVLIPDRDQAGLNGAEQSACMLYGLARSIRIAHLPAPYRDKGGDDVRDVLRQANGRELVLRAIEAARPWRDDSHPELDADCQDLPIITAKAWEAIGAANDPPFLFLRGGEIVRIETVEGAPKMVALDKDRMRYALARAANWCTTTTRGKRPVKLPAMPPPAVVADVLATPNPPLPELIAIVECPVFTPDGSVQSKAGYSATTGYYYAGAPFDLATVPEKPTVDELDAATELIATMIGDFPFASQADRANCFAALLLPFVRPCIIGPTPLHLISKPKPGTGAGLLCDSLGTIVTGRALSPTTECRSDDDWRKKLLALLGGGPTIILLDNLNRRLESAAIASAITSYPTWQDRLLGFSEMDVVPVRCLWLAAANNPAMSAEIARRTVLIRMDAKCERPWERKGFKIENLRTWTKDNRQRLVAACLTIIRAWFAAGRPRGQQTLGMFESWAETMGGILDVAGIVGFMDNAESLYQSTDDESEAVRAFIARWWEAHRSAAVTLKELYPLATADDAIDLGDGNEQSQRIRLGKMLGRLRDCFYSIETSRDGKLPLMISKGGTRARAVLWRLQTTGEGGDE